MAVLTSKTNHVAQDLELGERRTTQSWSVLEQEDRDHPSHGCTRRQVSWLLFWIRRSLHLSDYLKAAAGAEHVTQRWAVAKLRRHGTRRTLVAFIFLLINKYKSLTGVGLVREHRSPATFRSASWDTSSALPTSTVTSRPYKMAHSLVRAL